VDVSPYRLALGTWTPLILRRSEASAELKA